MIVDENGYTEQECFFLLWIRMGTLDNNVFFFIMDKNWFNEQEWVFLSWIRTG